jgi:hypothetical protein
MTDSVEERMVVDRVQLCGRLAVTIGGQTIEGPRRSGRDRTAAMAAMKRGRPVLGVRRAASLGGLGFFSGRDLAIALCLHHRFPRRHLDRAPRRWFPGPCGIARERARLKAGLTQAKLAKSFAYLGCISRTWTVPIPQNINASRRSPCSSGSPRPSACR